MFWKPFQHNICVGTGYAAINNGFLRIEDIPEELCDGNPQDEAEDYDVEDYTYYCNRANTFSLCLASRLKKHLVSVLHRRNSFSIAFLDPYNETAINLKKKLTACYKNNRTCKAKVEGEDKSILRYTFFQKGSDLVYQLHHSGFLQKIVLYKKRAQYEFAFMLQMYEQVMVEQENGDIVIFPKDSERVIARDAVFCLVKPIIQDMMGESGCNISVSLEQITDLPNRYLMKVKLDAEWMNADERAFPVTLTIPFEKGGENPELPVSVMQLETKSKTNSETYYVGQQGENTHSVCMRLLNPMYCAEFAEVASKIEKALLVWDIKQNAQGANYSIRMDNCVVDTFYDGGKQSELMFDVTDVVKKMITRDKKFIDFFIEPLDKMLQNELELTFVPNSLQFISKTSPPYLRFFSRFRKGPKT